MKTINAPNAREARAKRNLTVSNEGTRCVKSILSILAIEFVDTC